MAGKSYSDQELIDSYLRDQLDAAAQQAFELRRQDPGFQERLHFYQDAQLALRVEGRRALKAELQALEQAQPISPPEKRIPTLRPAAWLALAAAFILLLAAGVWGLRRSSPEDRLLAQAQAYPNVLFKVTRKAESQTDDPFMKAFGLYEQGDYAGAAQRFSQLIVSQDSLLAALHFYLGQSYFAMGRYDAARTSLEQSREPGGRFSQATEWYLALCYLQQGEKEKALLLLEQISQQPNHPFIDQAADALNQLR